MKSYLLVILLNIVGCFLISNVATPFPLIVHYENGLQYVIQDNVKHFISREQANKYENEMKETMNNSFHGNDFSDDLSIDTTSCEYRLGSAMGEINKFNNLLRNTEWDYNVYGINPDYDEIEQAKYSLDYIETELVGCNTTQVKREFKHITFKYAEILQYN